MRHGITERDTVNGYLIHQTDMRDMLKEVEEKIWQIQGASAGLSVVILGGVHGDERTGIEVIRTLVDVFNGTELQAGTLTLALGNPRAIELHRRGSDSQLDLNRLFTLDLEDKNPDGTYENARARQLLPFLLHADILIDIHSTSKPAMPFICSSLDARHMELYKWFPTNTVLSDPRHVLAGRVASTDEYVDAQGGVGMCFESG